jgi:NADPH-dependent ferric siderophore reductase
MGRLARLSDRTLKDIGFDRSEVCSIAYWRETDRSRYRNLRAGG